MRRCTRPTPPGQTALAFAGWGTPPEDPPFPSYSYHFPTRLLSKHKTLYKNHSFAVYTLVLLGTTISVSLSRAPLIPPPRISAPAFLFVSGRSQAYTPARWKRFSLPLAKKVAKQFVEAFRDAYGDALCLSAYCRDAEPGIRRAKVLASKTTSVPGGGK
jgi:hypothetical protein